MYILYMDSLILETKMIFVIRGVEVSVASPDYDIFDTRGKVEFVVKNNSKVMFFMF